MADSGDVVKRITITASGDGIESTTSSVNDLSNAFDNALQKSQSSISGLALGLSFGAAIAGLSALSDYIVKANKELADMNSMANQVGLTLKDFQSIQFGGAVQGLTGSQVNAGLQQSAQLLNDASRNSNTLSKELDANGISIKNANGQLISENQLLTIAGKLVANAQNPGDEQAIAKMLGYTKEWIPLLEQVGTQGFASITDAAENAGGIIDDATIKRATEFDSEWKKSSAQWAVYMKAAIADMLPEIDDVIKKASDFIQSVKNKGGGIDGTVKATADAALNSVGIDPNQMHTLEVSPEVSSSWSTFTTELGKAKDLLIWLAADPNIAEFLHNAAAPTADTPKPLFKVTTTNPYPVSQDPMEGSGYGKSGPADFNAIQKAMDQAQDDAQDLADKYSKVAKNGDDVNDMLDRAINALRRHTDQTAADADAVGLGAGALAGLKAEASLTSAAIANGTTITPKLAAQFKELGEDAADAANDLAKVKAASDISRGTQTAFLSPADVTIANQLKGIYGDDIPKALNSSEAAALRMNNMLSTINTTLRTGAETFATDFVGALVKGESIMDALKAGATALGTTLLNSGLKSLVDTGLNAIAPSASQTASATSSAAILTSAGTALAASMVAGATSAAAILAGGGTAAGVGVDVGTSVGGAALVTSGASTGLSVGASGVAAGTALAAGGTAAGLALWGPIAALAAVAAGVGLSLFGGSSSAQQKKDASNKAQEDQAAQINADAATRRVTDLQNAQLAGVDQTTLAGQLQAFDVDAQNQRTAEYKAGDGAIVELEKSLAAQRLAIVQKSNDAITKSMNDFLNSVKTGSQSILSPTDQLAYEQNLFNTQLAGAQGGDSDDLNALTTTASALLTLAQNFYASGTGYADTYTQVTNAIQSIANNPNQHVAPDAGVSGRTVDDYMTTIDLGGGNIVAEQLAEGGIVGNGTFNKDSVLARYAGGGKIALAGGEAVTRATSVNSNTIGMLNHINKTGKTPSNDNSDVVRVLTQGFNGQTTVLGDKLDMLASRVKSLEDTTRQTNNQRRVPGTRAA